MLSWFDLISSGFDIVLRLIFLFLLMIEGDSIYLPFIGWFHFFFIISVTIFIIFFIFWLSFLVWIRLVFSSIQSRSFFVHLNPIY